MKYTQKWLQCLALSMFFTCLGNGSSLAEWQIKAVKLSSAPAEIVLRRNGRGLSKVRVKSVGGKWMSISICAPKLCSSVAEGGLYFSDPPRDGLPDGKVGVGANDIKSAWLSKPTRRYTHGILGDRIEAGGLSVVDKLNETHELNMPLDEVFEDRYARVVDLDGDKSDEIIAVVSSRTRGASLAVFKLTGEGLARIAETKPLGRKGDWLNPAGIGDFDGDGRTEIALVTNPHRGGRLEIWEYDGGKLMFERSLRGFSNHVRGSRVLRMSGQADFDGDGKTDLVLPGVDRSQLRIISLAGGMVAEPAYIKLPGRIVTQIVTIEINKKPAVVAGLDTGIVVLVSSGTAVEDDGVPNWYKKSKETSLLQGMVDRNRRREVESQIDRRIEYGKPSR